jgi:hypothetical protein
MMVVTVIRNMQVISWLSKYFVSLSIIKLSLKANEKLKKISFQSCRSNLIYEMKIKMVFINIHSFYSSECLKKEHFLVRKAILTLHDKAPNPFFQISNSIRPMRPAAARLILMIGLD